jgi:glycosyltransferase 2 family protein
MSPVLRRTLHWVGSGLALIGIVFVALRLHKYWGNLDFYQFTTTAWASMIGLALLYGFANLLLALAWRHFLAHFGV